MRNHFFSNLIVGVALLFSLIIFHRLTFFLLTPPLNFFEDIYSLQKRAEVIEAISQNPRFVFGYLIAFFFHIVIALICVFFRYFLNHNITIIDVVLISLTPAILIFLYEVSVILILFAVTKDHTNIYSSAVVFKNIMWLASNTIILIIGNLIGRLAVNLFIIHE